MLLSSRSVTCDVCCIMYRMFPKSPRDPGVRPELTVGHVLIGAILIVSICWPSTYWDVALVACLADRNI